MFIIILYLAVFCGALYLLHCKGLLSVKLGTLVTLSWLATLVAAYYAYATQITSVHKFFVDPDASFGWSYQFAVWLTQSVMKPLAGGSYFLTYLGYACLGFLGRVFAVLTFYHICRDDGGYPDYRQFFFGHGQWVCLLLLLWPTAVFWSSLLGKDSLQYCCLFLLLYSVLAHQGWQRLFVAGSALVVLTLVRPYTAVLITLALFLNVILLGRFRIRYRLLGWLVLLVLGIVIVDAQVIQSVYDVNLINWDSIAQAGLNKQLASNHGTALALPLSQDSNYWLNLPWVMFANMFLPLPGLYTTDMHAWLAAILNCALLGMSLVVVFWVSFKRLQLKGLTGFNYLMFMLGWAIIGVGLLALVNTNLGWADRQKIPYVTMLIMIYGAIIYLAWAAKRQPIQQSQRRKKMLFIVGDDAYFLSHRLALAQYVQRQGWDVLVACGDAGQLDRIKSYGFKVIGFEYDRNRRLADLDLFFTLRRVIIQERPDIIHNVALRVVFVSMLSLKSLVMFKHRVGKVNAIMGLGHLFTHQSLKIKLMRFVIVRVLRWLFNQDDSRVIVQNQDDYQILTQHMIPAHKTALIKGSGVELGQYQQRQYETKPATFHITMASRLIKPKGVYEFYEAARLLSEWGYDAVQFHLYGEPYKANPQSISVETCLAWNHSLANFVWHGHVNDVVAVYQNTQVAVLPSFYREGIPKGLIEAAACGVPLITTDTPGCRDICQHQVNGLLVPPKDAWRLAEAVLYFVNNPQQIAVMGQAGRDLVEQVFTADQVNQQTWQVYESILQCKPLLDGQTAY